MYYCHTGHGCRVWNFSFRSSRVGEVLRAFNYTYCIFRFLRRVLGAFAELREVSISFVMCVHVSLSVLLSVRVKQLCSHCTDFTEI